MRVFTMTERDLHAVMRSGCGIKRAQAMLLGIPWPLRKGWKESVVGLAIDESTYRKLMDTRPKMNRFDAFKIAGVKPPKKVQRKRNSKNSPTQ